ncbi:MAG TPA: immunoglobulin domain-containing protein, partial [Verrucomicrobiae bacterium]
AINTNSWITIISGATNAGASSNTLTYTYTANSASASRTGFITIEDKVFAVTQWGQNCEVVLSPIARVHTNTPVETNFTISTSSGCEWTIQNTNDWITFTNQSGNTSSNITYSLAANLTGAARVGVVWVNDQSFTIIQQGCWTAIEPEGRGHFYIAQTNTVCVGASSLCAWSVSNTNEWISFLSSPAGVGNARLDYVVAANHSSQPRTGTFLIEGLPFTVTQDGKPCLYDIDPPEANYGEEGTGFAEVFVFADAGCGWSVSSPVSWLTVLLGEGDGQGSVFYVVEPNYGPARSTTLEIAGQYHEVSQASGVREIRVSDMMIASGETNSIFVMLDGHGGENSLAFSLCFDPNLLIFTSAALEPSAPVGASLSMANESWEGRVGFLVEMPAGYSMPVGTGVVIKVSFRAALVNGKPTTTISFCDWPVPRQLLNPFGGPLTGNFGSSTVHIIGLCSLAEALDVPDWNWAVNTVPWICQTNVTHDLEDAASSGVTPENGESYMETTVNGPGILSFWWKVSSEPSNDRLRFVLDGTTQFTISGEMPDWEWRTISVTNGPHFARWRYTKNANGITGLYDRGWVDQVVFAPLPPSITGQPASQTVDAGNTATFAVTATGQPPLTYQWMSNHIAIANGPDVSGAQTATLRLSNVQPAHAASYSVAVHTPEGSLNSANALLTVVPLLPLPEALDATNLVWITNGNAGWVGQSATNHDGIDAARSGNITNNQISSFQTTLTGPGTLTFWWKVSSQANGDYLAFTNGTQWARISGESNWHQKTFAIGSGSQTLRWAYTKNGSTTTGQDRGWVDEVRFIPAPVSITAQPTNQLVDQGAAATIAVGVSGTPPIFYQWLFNDEYIAGANSATFTIPNAQLADAGLYSVIVTNIAGTAGSSNALLQVNQIVPLAEAVDATNLSWTVPGTPPWVGQIAVSQDGSDAARSGRIDHNGTTTFRTTVTGPGTVSFWWKVSSEPGNDRLRFYMGPSSSLSEQQNISGNVDWTWRTWSVASGSQVLEWRYVKNGSIVSNLDCGWVDQIHYVPQSTPTAPFMAIQPTSRTIVAPTNVSFSALAGGSTPLSYQWFFNGSIITNGPGVSGAISTNLTITNATAARAGDYSLLVSNAAGTLVSSVAHLTVITAPVITIQPVSQNVLAGTTVNFVVGALGQAPLTYQWMFNGANLNNLSGKVSGATTPTLTLTGVQSAQEGTYSVLVSNAAGTALSSLSGALTTWNAARSAVVANGESTALSAIVTGPGTVKFSWKVSSETNSDSFSFRLSGQQLAAISGETDWRTETFAVAGGIQSLEWRYSKDGIGSAGLDAGFLDAVEFSPDGAPTAPVIFSQPIGRTVLSGATITLEAGVSGSLPLDFQWRFNDVALLNGNGVSGAKTPRLTLAGVQPAQTGAYSLFVSNLAGSVTSFIANVTVTAAPAVTVGAPVVTTPPASQNVSENASVSFNVVAAGTTPLSYRWRFHGTNLTDGNGVSGTTTATLTLSNVSPAQIGSYSVMVSNAVGTTVSPAASLSVLTLAEAAGAPYLNLVRAGDASWIAQTTVTFDGVNAVRTGPIADGQNTRLETWVDGPGTITFRWKVSCESGNDNLRFYIGAAEMARISGEQPAWTQQSYAVPVGTQILLKWRYGKDTVANTSSGQDAGWVDDVQYVFTGTTIAPSVTNQPISQITSAGATVTFNAGASGSLPLTYQWRLNGASLSDNASVSGVKTPRLTLSGVQPAQAGDYSLFISNSAGTVSSSVASLSVTTILAAPVISTHPISQTVNQGLTATFSAVATGAAPLSYRWQFNGANLVESGNVSGTTTPTLTLNNVQPIEIGNYSLVVSNPVGAVSSSAASLTLLSLNEIVGAPYLNFSVSPAVAGWTAQSGSTYVTTGANGGARLTVSIPPSITSQPANQTINAGNDVSFTVGIGGTAPLSVQWYLNGAPLSDGDGMSGTTTPTLLLTEVQAASAGNYSAVVSNAVGIATSANAALTVITPPTIITDPLNQLVAENFPASFSVLASGTAPLSYRWRRNGSNLLASANVVGVTTAFLTLNSAHPSQAGSYSVEVSNAAGVAVSDAAQLLVNAAMTMGEAMNAPYLEWNTDPSAPWIVQTNVTHDGEATAQSGNITNAESTLIETVVSGPGTIRFWWKVSSQTNADILSFTVNGSVWAQISGVVDWQQLVFNVPAGEVTL